jgi:hypothetical protein
MFSINYLMNCLGLSSSRARKRLLLEPELVDAALARLDHELTLDEQIVVLRAVGDRKKVCWPEWWEV